MEIREDVNQSHRDVIKAIDDEIENIKKLK